MKRPIRSPDVCFEINPGLACARLAVLLSSDPESSVQKLDYLLYQYSTLPNMTLLDEHMPCLVEKLISLPFSSREPAWSTLYCWVNHRAAGRRKTLLETSLIKGVLSTDNDWLSARWRQLGQRTKISLATKISQTLSGTPPLPALFPMGGVIVRALRTRRYALGLSQSTLMSGLDNLIGWGGREFSLALSNADRSFLASQARREALHDFPNIRSAAMKFAIDRSMDNSVKQIYSAPPVL